jgi:hypothetical protein
MMRSLVDVAFDGWSEDAEPTELVSCSRGKATPAAESVPPST